MVSRETIASALYRVLRDGALLLVIVLCGVATVLAQEPRQPAASGVLRVGVQLSLPPFSYVDARGRRVGFEVDLAQALCDALQRRCELVPIAFQEVIAAIQARRLDAAVVSMSITESRKQQVDFTAHYYVSPARFVARPSRVSSTTPESLSGRLVGLKRGTTFEAYAMDMLAGTGRIVRYAHTEDALVDLVLGRVDTVLADGIFLRESFLDSAVGREFEFVGEPLDDPRWFGEGIGIPIAKGNEALRKQFDDALQELRRTGVYNQIRRQYFDYDIYRR